MERLWAITAGIAGWKGSPAIKFPAITHKQVDKMLSLPVNAMPWILLVQVLPDCVRHNLDTESLPAICVVRGGSLITYDGFGMYPLDLVAATFILLTRWEEWAFPLLDQFGRHQEDATLCARQNFRERPVLDEWASMLRPWLEKQNPAWQPNLPHPSIWISHDIDHLRYYRNLGWVARGFMRGLFRQNKISVAINNVREGVGALLFPHKDPCVQSIFDLIDLNEALGQHGTFFFMTAQASQFDEGYNLDCDYAKVLLQSINERGHEIGWHPGFVAAKNDHVFTRELNQFQYINKEYSFGVRHHFLRWQAGISWKRLVDNGITFDASVGYSGCVGFRASTSHYYPAYDLLSDIPLPIEVRPLIVMDGPLLKNPVTAIENINLLMQRTHAVNGCFSILIHNYSMMLHSDIKNIIMCSKIGSFKC